MELSKCREFLKFIDDYIIPSRNDIENLGTANRVHIQKLLYTNTVDRFDAMIDGVLLDNCRHGPLLEKATSGMNKEMTEADLVVLLINNDSLQTAITDKLKDALRLSVLRERHSKKLRALLSALCPDDASLISKKPRVHLPTGELRETATVSRHQNVPQSVCGYADWLYSRRNTIVHGSGSSNLLTNDKLQLKKTYGCEVADTIRITIQAVDKTVQFYQGVTQVIISGG
jgi:hypothetical protein